MRKFIFFVLAAMITVMTYAQDKVYAPTLVTPADSAVNQMADAFVDWSAVAGSTMYEVQFDTSAIFVSPLKIFTSLSAANAYDLLYGLTYNWRVRAIGNPGDTSAWSVIRSFTVRLNPQLTYPADSSGRIPVTPQFKWVALTGSVGYIIEIDTLDDFTSPFAFQTVTTTSGVLADIILGYYGQDFYYRIKAYHSADTSDWSEVRYFQTYSYPVLQTPLDLAVDQIPVVELQFKGIVGSASYQYEYSIYSDFSISQIINVPLTAQTIINPSNPVTRDTVVKVMADSLPYAETIYWRARAKNSIDTSDWCPYFAMDIIPDVKILWAPAASAIDVSITPTFKWKKINGSSHYELQYGTDPTFVTVNSVIVNHPTTTHDTVSYVVTFPHLLISTNYYWRVRAYNDRYSSNWLDESFTTRSDVAVNDFSFENNLSIYPNPSKGKISVQMTAQTQSAYTIQITNVVGQIVIHKTGLLSAGKNSIPFNLEELNNGIYFLNVQVGQNTATRKVILDK